MWFFIIPLCLSMFFALLSIFLLFVSLFKESKNGKYGIFASICSAFITLISAIQIIVPSPSIYPLDNETRSYINDTEITIKSDVEYFVKTYYSLDGTDPKEGKIYTEPIVISESTTVCSRNKFLWLWSDICTNSYIFDDTSNLTETFNPISEKIYEKSNLKMTKIKYNISILYNDYNNFNHTIKTNNDKEENPPSSVDNETSNISTNTTQEQSSPNTTNISSEGEVPQNNNLVTISGITLSSNYLEIKNGTTIDLVATVLYSNNTTDTTNHSVTWTSSNNNIAVVDNNGHITAVGVGTTTIIANANNTSQLAICNVKVTSPPTGYSISLSTYSTMIGSPFYVYVDPNENDISEIKVHAKAPSGNIDTYILNSPGRYYIDTEIGTWTIYATIKNQYGVYEATIPSDFVNIEVRPFSF